MNASEFDSTLLTVWEQSLVRNARSITVGGEAFPVRATAKQKLKQVDFRFEGRELRGLEQNPNSKSRWAAMARKGLKVMQFLENGKYLAVAVDGKLHHYSRK
jgi:hypothetical protein